MGEESYSPAEDAAAILACVEEFYSTRDEHRRQHLNQQLCHFNTGLPCRRSLSACLLLCQPGQSANAQYFGAMSLYETIRERWEECVEDQTMTDQLKRFLLEGLDSGSVSHSVANKLSSALALLALYSMPDVWAAPVTDLTGMWSSKPCLLLRVLADVASEFAHVKMRLTERSALKTELHRVAEEVQRVVSAALASSPSGDVRSAAVACVEAWLQLPGVRLEQWTQLLGAVFQALQGDTVALASLLNIVASSEEVSIMDALLGEICDYMVRVLAEQVQPCLSRSGAAEDDESMGVVAAMLAVAEKAVPALVKRASRGDGELMSGVCSFAAAVSCVPGQYAVNEKVSDLPAVFWTTLREEITGQMTHKEGDPMNQVISVMSASLAAVLRSAVEKLAWPAPSQWKELDKEQRDQVLEYRLNRSELSVDAFYLMGGEPLAFLSQQMRDAVEAGSCERMESCLFLWNATADYLSEEEYPQIEEMMGLLAGLGSLPSGLAADRLVSTQMQLVYSLSHLVCAHPRAVELERVCIGLAASHLSRGRAAAVGEALRTLDKMLVDCAYATIESVGDSVSSACYSFFMEEARPEKQRLAALKCIGYVLSTRPADRVMEILNGILSSHVSDLAGGVNGKRRAFQVSIFAALFSSLQCKKEGAPSCSGDSAVVLMLRECVGVLEQLLDGEGAVESSGGGEEETESVGARVCDALRSALCSLEREQAGEFVPRVCVIVGRALGSHPAAACALAKTLLLLSCVPGAPGCREVCASACDWLCAFDAAWPSPAHEEWTALIYQLVRKQWRVIRTECGDAALTALDAILSLTCKVLAESDEPSVVRSMAQSTAGLLSQSTSSADEGGKERAAVRGQVVIQGVLSRLESEVMRPTIEALAEILAFYMKEYTQQTRAFLNTQPCGESALITAMFREVGNMRNFKQHALRFNMAARKDKQARTQ